jgi:hypothetical protein
MMTRSVWPTNDMEEIVTSTEVRPLHPPFINVVYHCCLWKCVTLWADARPRNDIQRPDRSSCKTVIDQVGGAVYPCSLPPPFLRVSQSYLLTFSLVSRVSFLIPI